jgi:ABC-type glycerol-3-phosphate transport system substrate-binding protein
LKKTKLIIVLLAVAALAIVGGLLSTQGKKQEATGSKKIVVTMNKGPAETDVVEVQRLREDIARFNKIYPEIEIRWTDRPYSPDNFSTSMAGGTAEDVINLWATEGYVIDRGYAVDLTDFIKDWEYKDQLNTEILAPFIRDGRIYALPIMAYVQTLAYNKKLFTQAGIVDANGEAKPPATWEEFASSAQKLTNRRKGVSGFGMMGQGAECGWGFINWVWQAGGEFEKKVDGKWKAVFDSPEAISALQFIKDLRWKHDCLQANLLATREQLTQLFAANQIGMLIENQGVVSGLANKYGADKDDLGIALLPAGAGGRVNQMGGDFFIINPKSSREVQEAAFKWISWRILGSVDPKRIVEKGQDLRKQGRIGTLPAPPPFIGKLSEEYKKAAEPYGDVLVDFPDVWLEAIKYVRPEPPFFCQQLYSEILAPAIQAVVTKKNSAPAKLMQAGAKTFQTRFLDQVKD